ncbi:MAG: proton-translocating NADH-quinone oxidoreductase, chain [Myxococcaceae bacterium]|nr:proton-translocating NADH-quinone oxidoreductase, chain [Myxococcaceae bacterium]
MSPIFLGLLATLAPAAAALLLLIAFPLRHRGAPAAWICILGSLTSLGAAGKLLVDRLGGAPDARWVEPWILERGVPMAEMGVLIDGVSLPMLIVVCLVALCVQVFSIAYMHDEPPRAFGRYFTLHALFLFSMNVVVVAPNLLQLFFGWELVGLTSYLLIGFYFAKPSAARAAVKAFWMTKLADMGFLFGLLVLFVSTGGFEWTSHPSTAVATAVTALLFVAVVGKSAQFPLHIWLPDAMEGPTPVSALLHAATMVAAGVYLVVRADPLFALAPATRDVMLWIGAGTAVFAAGLAMVQNDLKKVLAFSTCSQLGYMIAALGAGSAFAGFFHLGTHAFFKALLFLAAGSVIHAVHSNELSQMGGLRKKLPLTTTAFVIGALSLAGIPGFAGFFSKDLVLASLEGRAHWVPWTMLMGAAFLTAFYMGRVVVKAFWGQVSEKSAHAHEGGLAITGPLVVLAIPALLSGLLGGWLASQVSVPYSLHLGLTPIVASSMGLAGVAAAVFVFGTGRAAPFAATLEKLDRLSLVDRSWAFAYQVGLQAFPALFGWIDRYLVDGLMNFSGWSAIEAGASARKLQTGKIRDYALMVVAGVIALALIGVLR